MIEEADRLTSKGAGLPFALTFMSDCAEVPKGIVKDDGSAERLVPTTMGALHVCTK